jgi:hypothetical protein
MTIAAKIIAGCSPIAAKDCNDAPTIFVVEFIEPTSRVFTPLLLDPLAGEGDCICVPWRHNTAIACPVETPEEEFLTAYAFHDTAYAYCDYNDIVAPGVDTDMEAYELSNDAATDPSQKCKEAA